MDMTPENKLALKKLLQINPSHLTASGKRKRAEIVADVIKTDEGFYFYWETINGRN